MAKVKHPLSGEQAQEQIEKATVENIKLEKEPKGAALGKEEQIEWFLDGIYEFFFNEIKRRPEYKDRDNDKEFKQVDKRVLASLKRLLAKHGFFISVDGLMTMLVSDFTPAINPINKYFEDIEWNGEDSIKILADTVTVVNTGHWKEFLTKWLIGVVANALTPEACMNHTMLVLTGAQSKFKTTWLDNLCPKSLKAYLYTGKIDTESKDILTQIAEYFLINVDDQLKALNKKDENALKNYITCPNVKYRRPYDPCINDYPHLASFMGSVNGNDFLTDPTGSRRFLPFEIENININAAQKMDMDNVWAQAYYLWKQGQRYWFTEEETIKLHEHNQAFNVISIEEQLLVAYFSKPLSRSAANCYLQSAEILSKIEQGTKQRLSPKKIGEALQKLGFEKWQRTVNAQVKWVYSMYELSPAEREIETTSLTINDHKDELKLNENDNGDLPF